MHTTIRNAGLIYYLPCDIQNSITRVYCEYLMRLFYRTEIACSDKLTKTMYVEVKILQQPLNSEASTFVYKI